MDYSTNNINISIENKGITYFFIEYINITGKFTGKYFYGGVKVKMERDDLLKITELKNSDYPFLQYNAIEKMSSKENIKLVEDYNNNQEKYKDKTLQEYIDIMKKDKTLHLFKHNVQFEPYDYDRAYNHIEILCGLHEKIYVYDGNDNKLSNDDKRFNSEIFQSYLDNN